MAVIIVGGGVGGLTAALMLHRQGIECRVYEQSASIRELGVGINMLPHAVRELRELGLLDRLDAAAVRTYELFYLNRRGQRVWHELRGVDAGHDVPQLSIHRGTLQGVIYAGVRERLGEDAVRTDRRLMRFEADAGGVTAWFQDRDGGEHVERGEALIGADGIRSTVRAALYPDEGPPRWNGAILWRGCRDWPAFLTGRSMLIAGGMRSKVVVYPIGPGASPETRLTNWAVIGHVGGGDGPPPHRADWSRRGRREDLAPHIRRFEVTQVDVPGLLGATTEFYEYPMCDRDPLPGWSRGRVTLLGDAAHPMYPVGSNGASQAILDARALAGAMAAAPVEEALREYERERLPATAEIVTANRGGGPEGVIDAVEALAPDGFDDIEAVLPHAEREAIVRGYARTAGFAVPTQPGGDAMSETTWSGGVTRSGAGLEGISWSILGQTYVPMHVDDRSFAWHATLPPGTFVPPHRHTGQDEFVYMLGGALDVELDGGAPVTARVGDLVRMPMGVPHGLFNRGRETVTCVFWVTPARSLWDLFVGIDALPEQAPDAVVALSAEHEVEFLPPPPDA